MKRAMLLLCGLLLAAQNNFGEINQTFSNTLMFIVGHVSSDFSILKGKQHVADAGQGGERYTSKGRVMGARWNDIVHDAAGWHYEGLMYEGEVQQLREHYKSYEAALREPMHNAGYTRTEQKHREAELAGSPDLVFTWKRGSPVIKLVILPGTAAGSYQLVVQVMK